MEFCGGGSLQEIYHGEARAPGPSRPQRSPTPTPLGYRRGLWALDLGSSPLLPGCVTLREILSISGFSILD